MSKTLPTTSTRSWKDLDQGVAARTTPLGRKRAFKNGFRVAGALLIVGVVSYGIWVVVDAAVRNPKKITSAAPLKPLKDPILLTDGKLDNAWLARALDLKTKVPLAELDLYQLKRKLIAFPQVKTVEITRDFSENSLVVIVQERVPILLVRVQEGKAEPKDLYVAKDGVIFEGINLETAFPRRLPYLDGVRLKKIENGYERISGMLEADRLLTTARVEAPQIYKKWRVVSLERFADYGEITAKGPDIPEAVFTSKDNYLKQLARLDSISDYADAQQIQIARIDLSIGNQVAAEPPLVSPHSNFVPSSFSSTSKKSKRDL